MDNKKLDNIQNAADQFLTAIESSTGKPAIIAWGVFDSDKTSLGIITGDDISPEEMKRFGFQVSGRLFEMIEWDDEE